MMDVDDGYILWTGIWKGVPLVALPHPISYLVFQHSEIPKVRGYVTMSISFGNIGNSSTSRYCQDDRFAA